METLMATEVPQHKTGRLARRLARLLRRKRSPAGAGLAYSVASDVYDESSLDSSINSLSKLKLSGGTTMAAAAYTGIEAFFTKNAAAEKEGAAAPMTDADAFVAGLFAGVSAVKASYVQLQLAQHPFDAGAIQSADAAVVAEFSKFSASKRRYVRDSVSATKNGTFAMAEEQRHLIRTYEITARKLETELCARNVEVERARAELADARAVEERSLAALDGLRLSSLNATHFLTVLRYTVESISSFARSMLDEMRVAGWDPAAAAAAVHKGVPLHHPSDGRFALESYVALKMFSNFHRRDFGLIPLQHRESHDRGRFFEEFTTELKSSSSSAAFLDARSSLGKFTRDRYSSVVHERMEAAFPKPPPQRDAASSTGWFAEFAEMARRVWLLHCVFFAFHDGSASVFQARAGSRFSEVYMESVSDLDVRGVVGFTVVPGFKVGLSVVQCRVYLSRPAQQQQP